MPFIPHLGGTVFGVFFNDAGQVLLLKRINTGYYDGGYSLPAGHIEDGEHTFPAFIREMKEELGIDIERKNIKPIHVIHRISDRQYFDVGFKVENRHGVITNKEPEKCEALEWHDTDNLPEYIAEEAKVFIKAGLEENDFFSELDLR